MELEVYSERREHMIVSSDKQVVKIGTTISRSLP